MRTELFLFTHILYLQTRKYRRPTFILLSAIGSIGDILLQKKKNTASSQMKYFSQKYSTQVCFRDTV